MLSAAPSGSSELLLDAEEAIPPPRASSGELLTFLMLLTRSLDQNAYNVDHDKEPSGYLWW